MSEQNHLFCVKCKETFPVDDSYLRIRLYEKNINFEIQCILCGGHLDFNVNISDIGYYNTLTGQKINLDKKWMNSLDKIEKSSKIPSLTMGSLKMRAYSPPIIKNEKFVTDRISKLFESSKKIVSAASTINEQNGEDLIELYKNAFDLAKDAAMAVEPIPENQPSRAEMFIFAASLAVLAECKNDAIEMILQALKGQPPILLYKTIIAYHNVLDSPNLSFKLPSAD